MSLLPALPSGVTDRLSPGMAADLCLVASLFLPLPFLRLDAWGFQALQVLVLGFALFREEGQKSLMERVGTLGWLLLGVVALGPLMYLAMLFWAVFDQGVTEQLPELVFQCVAYAGVLWVVLESQNDGVQLSGYLRPVVTVFSSSSVALFAGLTVIPLYFRGLADRVAMSGFSLLDPASWQVAFYGGSGFVVVYWLCVRGLVSLRPPMSRWELLTLVGTIVISLV